MNEPHDPNLTTVPPSASADALEPGRTATFATPSDPLATNEGRDSGSTEGGRADAPASDLPAVPGYRVLREIAHGGMGRVLAAFDLTLGREVALKLLLPGANAERFVRESKITARLAHPNIPAVYALGTLADGSPFLAMKLIAGRTLADEMKTAERSRLLQTFAQVCQAVGFAHSCGVIHRDLKPANVMVGAFGEVQVMDWGLAKDVTSHEVADLPRSSDTPTVDTGEWVEDRTEAGQVLGTPAYMAPEQARGEAAEARADVFALGGILCAILTGKPPFSGSSALELIRRAGAGNLDDAHARLDACGADAELLVVCRRCLSPRAEDRPRNAAALSEELTAYLSSVEHRLRKAELAGVEARAREEEERKRRELTVAAQTALQRALTRQVAERLEGELGRLETMGHSLAALVAQRKDWEESQLVGWMDAMLRHEDRLFGLFVALDPRQFRPDLEDYGLYQFRGGLRGESLTKQLGPPAYPYREFDWYQRARETGEARWTEPFLDAEGGDVPMVCYTVPIHRREEFVGVVNVDLSIRYFERLRDWLRELDFGPRSYEFVLSRTGLFISHPLPEYDFASLAATEKPPRNIAEMRGADEGFLALTQRMLREDVGSGTAIDPTTGRPATWMFGRVQPAGWTFVAVVEGAAS